MSGREPWKGRVLLSVSTGALFVLRPLPISSALLLLLLLLLLMVMVLPGRRERLEPVVAPLPTSAAST